MLSNMVVFPFRYSSLRIYKLLSSLVDSKYIYSIRWGGRGKLQTTGVDKVRSGVKRRGRGGGGGEGRSVGRSARDK